jgi:hypothetical protein
VSELLVTLVKFDHLRVLLLFATFGSLQQLHMHIHKHTNTHTF